MVKTPQTAKGGGPGQVHGEVLTSVNQSTQLTEIMRAYFYQIDEETKAVKPIGQFFIEGCARRKACSSPKQCRTIIFTHSYIKPHEASGTPHQSSDYYFETRTELGV